MACLVMFESVRLFEVGAIKKLMVMNCRSILPILAMSDKFLLQVFGLLMIWSAVFAWIVGLLASAVVSTKSNPYDASVIGLWFGYVGHYFVGPAVVFAVIGVLAIWRAKSIG